MTVEIERFNDSSPPDPDGMYEYQYRGVVYRVRVGPEELALRVYDGETKVATLISPAAWTTEWLAGPAFQEACRYLREQTGVRRVQMYNPLTGTYTVTVALQKPDHRTYEAPAP